MATEIKRVGDTCKVTCENNNKAVDAVVMEFQEKKKLVAIINKSVKIVMQWNGKVYEGGSSGLSFISNGPKIETSFTGNVR